LIRYVCEELTQKRSQGVICRLFGYVNQVYEDQIESMENHDKNNTSSSAYGILVQENLKLTKTIEMQNKRQADSEEEKNKEINKLTKKHSLELKELNDKIDKLKEINKAQIKSINDEKAKQVESIKSDDSESDIFEGLSESKKEKIMSEVTELYEANIALQYENNILSKKLEKIANGGKILDSNDNYPYDSMNVESDMNNDPNETLFKYGSYTNNDDLGNSHYNESVGSIHNIYVDKESKSYQKAIEREKIMRLKPEEIPTLDFDKLGNQNPKPSLKLKGSKNIKKIKVISTAKPAGYSMSNRTIDEKYNFEDQGKDETAVKLKDQQSIKLNIEEKKLAV